MITSINCSTSTNSSVQTDKRGVLIVQCDFNAHYYCLWLLCRGYSYRFAIIWLTSSCVLSESQIFETLEWEQALGVDQTEVLCLGVSHCAWGFNLTRSVIWTWNVPACRCSESPQPPMVSPAQMPLCQSEMTFQPQQGADCHQVQTRRLHEAQLCNLGLHC